MQNNTSNEYELIVTPITIFFFLPQIRRGAEECQDGYKKFFGALALDKILQTQLQKYSGGRRAPLSA